MGSKKVTIITIFVFVGLLACIIIPNVLPKYNTDWIIGKSVDKVVEKYGEFVFTNDHSGDKGMSGYYVKEESDYDLFGEFIPEKYLVIYFDEMGIAYKCIERWAPN